MLAKFLPFSIISVSLFLLWNAAPAGSDEVTNSVGMKFTLIPSGAFTMGADLNSENGEKDETPQRRVTISRPFYLGVYEVTQAEWASVMGGANPSYFSGRTLPVENVSWDVAISFIRKLNQKEGTEKYRLPTEAEWEYSARAGTTSAYFFGDDEGSLGKYAWFLGNSGDKTRPVGGKSPNPWGLYDIYGNVWEWVQDFYGGYAGAATTDPKGPAEGSSRVLRGCGWHYAADICRSATRLDINPEGRSDNIGLRLAFTTGDFKDRGSGVRRGTKAEPSPDERLGPED
ncbi:MAG: formylglycine-generating enzyme family protein [Deltaproteobacteria bacterium]|jgi:formylglycine-generating enzyme required for sulfatase activity|nr:formylglycine-generating enzyme family protein [Deltaproteobacteria bacterium]